MASDFELTKRLEVAGIDGFVPAPSWVNWMVEIGAVHAQLSPSKGVTRWTVITVPNRAFAAVLVALGAIVSNILGRKQETVFERFHGCSENEPLTWIDSNGHSRYGRLTKLDSPELDNPKIYYRQRVHGGLQDASRPVEKASSFWPAIEIPEFVGARPANSEPGFVNQILGSRVDEFLSRSSVDVALLGVKKRIREELSQKDFKFLGIQGSLGSIVGPLGEVPLGEHHHSLLFSDGEDLEADGSHEMPSLTIIDGSNAYLNSREFVLGASAVVLIDRWEPRAVDAADAAMLDKRERWVEADDLLFPDQPPGVELISWAGEQ